MEVNGDFFSKPFEKQNIGFSENKIWKLSYCTTLSLVLIELIEELFADTWPSSFLLLFCKLFTKSSDFYSLASEFFSHQTS